MATFFQTSHSAGSSGIDTKRTFNPTSFFSKKKKQPEPELDISAPQLLPLEPSTPAMDPVPAPEPIRGKTPKKIVKRQPSSDIDYELRQHLQQQGISFLAWTDPDAIGRNDREEKKKKPLPPPPKSVLDVAPKDVLMVTKQTVVTVESGANGLAKAGPVAGKVPVPNTKPAAATRNVGNPQLTLQPALESPEAARQTRSAAPQSTTPVLSPPQNPSPPPRDKTATGTRPTIAAVGSNVSVQPSTMKIERPPHAMENSAPPPQHKNHRQQPERKAVSHENGKPEQRRPDNCNGRYAGPNHNEAISGRQREQLPSNQRTESPPLADPAEIVRPDSTSHARYTLESPMDKMELESKPQTRDPRVDQKREEIHQRRDDGRRDDGRWDERRGPVNPNQGHPPPPVRGDSRRGPPPPELTNRRPGPPPNGNYPPPPNGSYGPYGNGHGPPRHNRRHSNGNGYYPPPEDHRGPNGYGNGYPTRNGYPEDGRRARDYPPHPSGSHSPEKMRSPEGTPPRMRGGHYESPPIQSDESDNRPSGSNSPSDDRHRSLSLPVPIMVPPSCDYTTNITDAQKNCEESHRRTHATDNIHHRIHCMVCATDAANERYLCCYCALRFCPRCKAEFASSRTFDEIRALALAEDWRSQAALPGSPKGIVSVNMAWEIASTLEDIARFRAPPMRLRQPPPSHQRRLPPTQQHRRPEAGHTPRSQRSHSSLVGRTETMDSTTIRADPPSPNGSHARLANAYYRDRSAESSAYEDALEGSDREAKKKALHRMMMQENTGHQIPILSGV